MPLTRDTVTAASQITLPLYVVTFTLLGINYVVTPSHTLTLNPALAFADSVMPLKAWGGLFIACAALMCAALLQHRRLPYRFALRLCGISMVVWACIIAAAAGPLGCLLASLTCALATLLIWRYGPVVRWRVFALACGLMALAVIVPSGDGTPFGFVWAGFVATGCFATDRSLQVREV
jgi:hypothetical protein